MFEILIAFLLAWGYNPSDLNQIQSSFNASENPEGIGSTANGTTTVTIEGTVWVISVDEKGNYIIYKQ
jgi:hypothetical protein